MSFADRFVYFPTREHDGGTPAAVGLDYDDVYLRTSDGVKLHAWFVPASSRRPVVLFLHGNAGNVSHRLDKLVVIHGLGVSVMLLDYRGYGWSDGEPSEDGTYRDAAAAYEWIIDGRSQPAGVLVYGESLGGTIGTDLAAHREVGGLVLESTPSSILAVARHHYPVLPIGLLLTARYDALARIGAVTAPLLILHSIDDEIVPFAMAEEMFGAARSPKRLVKLRGGHNDNFIVTAEAYRTALAEFITTNFPPA